MLKNILLLFITSAILYAQENPIPYTKASERMNGYKQRLELQQNSLLKNVKLTNIGPTVMSGRVTDFDVNPDDPTIFYVAYASGGLWKTESNGNSFTPLFENQASMTIGDIAVDWEDNIIYVGTGENNSSRSSYAGTGVYKSPDEGKTWISLGLEETHHTGRIILHPEDKNTLWVAAIGHLYSPNEERSVYKTTDGGKTWNKTLYIDENTGAIDLAVDTSNPDVLYAAMWHRTRRAWNFVEAGETSGIYKSVDGGETWDLISGGNSGFPEGEGVGRIGLSIFPGNPDVIYAFLDNQFHREKEEDEEVYALNKQMFRDMTKEEFLELNEKDLDEFLKRHSFPTEYNAGKVFEMVKTGEIIPSALSDYLGDANEALFDTPVIGAQVYKSTDAGKTWNLTHDKYLDDVVFSYGYYFGEIRVAPYDENEIYVLGVPLIKSTDGGKTFKGINGANVHADHQAMWVNPKRRGHIIDGNDGGINISYDGGESWVKLNNPPVGQFYTVNVDMAEPYNVYGGLQDNGVWYGPHTSDPADVSWHSTGEYPYKGLSGGDGMQVEIDTRTNDIVYTGFQFGNYYRIKTNDNDYSYIAPKHSLGEKPYRYNWQTPIHLSGHNQDILYMGSNKFHRSMEQGKDFKTMSDDLTRGPKEGDVPYGTLTTISESAIRFGLIYTGSDDGLVHVSKDGGYSWENISEGLPSPLWISRVEASAFEEERVYVSLNGYRWDNFNAYVYVSEDYGQTWNRIGEGLPSEPVNVIKEDPENKNLLYVGTDHGLYASLDRGRTFMPMFNGMPAVAVHDLVIHPRDKDIVVGTHGRSIYIANVEHVQALDEELMSKPLYVFDPEAPKYSSGWGSRDWSWGEPYSPSMELAYWAGAQGEMQIEITTPDGTAIANLTDEAEKGLNFLTYNLTVDEDKLENYRGTLEKESGFKAKDNGKYYLLPGEYKIFFRFNGLEEIRDIKIEES